MKKIIIISTAILLFGTILADVLRPNYYVSFNSGELSPFLKYRLDLQKRYMGVEKMQNMIVLPQGGTVRRPGTIYVGDIDEAGASRLIPFEFSTDDAYVLRFSVEKIYFYRTVGGVSGEIAQ